MTVFTPSLRMSEPICVPETSLQRYLRYVATVSECYCAEEHAESVHIAENNELGYHRTDAEAHIVHLASPD